MTAMQFLGAFFMVGGAFMAFLMWAICRLGSRYDDDFDDQFTYPVSKPVDLDEERAKREGHV